jgi:HD-GYP domain-containing protein (c-di-GMP phosphodiesterase class II)
MAEEFMNNQEPQEEKRDRNIITRTLLAVLSEICCETEAHERRVGNLCLLSGKWLGLSPRDMEDLLLLAVLHDIGKLGINREILLKPGELTSTEWVEMKRHAEIGYSLARSIPEIAGIADCILHHHERWDGKGYPDGLKGTQIPYLCRILAVADAYDAMTNDRIFRKAVSSDAAFLELRKNAGSQFDAEVVQAFLNMMLSKERVGMSTGRKAGIISGCAIRDMPSDGDWI